MGANERERFTDDSLTERAMDLRHSFGTAVPHSTPAEEKKALADAWVEKSYPAFSANLDAFLAKNETGSGLLVGAKITAADILFFTYLNMVKATASKVPFTEAQTKFLTAVSNTDGIKEFLADKEKNPANF